LFREAAERLGWIVVSSYDTLSDGPREPNERAMRAMLPDIQKRFRVDPRRIYLAGFSGTARVAWDFAYRIRGISGIVGVGGGLPSGMDSLSKGEFVFYGAAGTTDFNHEEMRALDTKLDATGIPHRITFFDGGHDWCPPDRCAEALDWMELQAMRHGLRERDPEFIDAMYTARTSRARELEAAGASYEAWVLYRAAAEDFEGLRDVSVAVLKAESLGETKEVRRTLSHLDRLAHEQAVYEGHIYDFIEQFRKSGPFRHTRSLIQLRVKSLLKRARADDPLEALGAQRLLELAFVNTAFYEPRDYMTAGDPQRAAAMLEVANAIKPSHPRVCYGLARARARLGWTEEALNALECAIDSGAVTAPFIEADDDLAPLRAVPRYRSLLSRLGSDHHN